MLRKVTDRMSVGRPINVMDFGAKGDGIADDTAAIQAAIELAKVDAKNYVYLPKGLYLVSRLVVYDNSRLVGAGRVQTKIKAISDAKNDALIVSSAWDGITAYSNGRIDIRDIDIDAAGIKDYALVYRSWDSHLNYCYVSGALVADLLITTVSSTDVALTPTMVNNVIAHCWIGVDKKTADYNILVRDPDNKATDLHIKHNFISGAKVANANIATAAGLHFTGNHLYGCAMSLQFQRGGLGTVIDGNYLEGGFEQNGMLAGDSIVTFGPGNYVRGDSTVSFGPNGSTVRSFGNTYEGTLTHNFFDVEKCLISENDIFKDADPFRFHNASSPGTIKVKNSYLIQSKLYITSSFNGTKKDWQRPAASEFGNNNAYVTKERIQGGSGEKTVQLQVPYQSTTDISFLFEFRLHTRKFHNQEILQDYKAEIFMIQKGSAGTWLLDTTEQIANPGEFQTPPAFTFFDNEDGTGTIQATWTPLTSEAYGAAILTAI